MRILQCAAAVLVLTAQPASATRDEYDQAMLKLATESGCMACHTVLPAPKRDDGLPPIAPAWRDVALKYRDDPGASERLTRIVLAGTDPKSRHWAGKVGPVVMPPNAGSLRESDARVLVNWILVLVP
jgi:cytochrome c